MRRRILTVALSAVVLAVVLLGVPLAIAIQRNAMTEERGELERAALQAASAVSPSYRGGDPVELPRTAAHIEVALYDVGGRRVSGPGPDVLEADSREAIRGRVVESATDSSLVEVVPVSVNEKVIGLVRASSPRSAVRATVLRDLLALGGLGLLALGGAGGFAYWQAHRLARPLRALAAAAADLGAGDFSVRPPASGVPEIDRTGAALQATARRLSEQIDRERAFTARASHQLRTPLTRLRLELEAGLEGGPTQLDAAARDALVTADHLSQTIDDVLALARTTPEAPVGFDVEALLTECVSQWRGVFATEDRPLRLFVETPLIASASRAAVRQVLQVLIDNAYRHGHGTVTLRARDSEGAVAVDVTDRGAGDVTWPPDGPTTGPTPGPADNTGISRLGLAMARSLAEAQHGRLLLDSTSSETRFTLLIPAT